MESLPSEKNRKKNVYGNPRKDLRIIVERKWISLATSAANYDTRGIEIVTFCKGKRTFETEIGLLIAQNF